MAFKQKAYWFLSDMHGSNVLMSEVRLWKRQARLGARRASKLGRGHKDSPTALWLTKMMVSLGDKALTLARVSVFLVLGGKYKIESLGSRKSIGPQIPKTGCGQLCKLVTVTEHTSCRS